jgi:hypothetical protein
MANTMELISSETVGILGASTVTFSSIPGTFTDLCIKVSSRTNRIDVQDSLKLTFNGNTSSYSARGLGGNASSAYSFTNGGSASIEDVLITCGSTSTSSTFGNGEIYIPNYAGSTFKSVSSDSVSENNANAANRQIYAALWSNTAAITSLTLAPTNGTSILQYSTFYLYGVKNA